MLQEGQDVSELARPRLGAARPFADYREVKPCVDALVQQPPHLWPMRIAVLQPNSTHAARTLEWAASLPSRGIQAVVHVVDSVEAAREPSPVRGLSGTGPPGPPSPQTTGDATRDRMLSQRAAMGYAVPKFVLMPVHPLCVEQVLTITQQSLPLFDFQVVKQMLIEAEPEF